MSTGPKVIYYVRVGNFKASPDADAVTRRHHVSVNGTPRDPVDRPSTQDVFTIDELNPGDQVEHRYSYLDQATPTPNESGQSPAFAFTMQDTFPPRLAEGTDAAGLVGAGQRSSDEPPPDDSAPIGPAPTPPPTPAP